MHSIAEYQSLREKAVAVSLTEIPEVRPYARRHVDQLQQLGHAGEIIKQLCREAQSRGGLRGAPPDASTSGAVDDVRNAWRTAVRFESAASLATRAIEQGNAA